MARGRNRRGPVSPTKRPPKNNGKKKGKGPIRKIAGEIGKGIWDVLSGKLLGSSENAPVSQGYRMTTSNPNMSSTKNGIRVQHLEFLGPLAGVQAGTFRNHAFQLNPGLQGAFPWLSKIARNFQHYKMHKLMLAVLPSCPTSTVGQVMSCFYPDPSDLPPASREQVLQTLGSTTAAPWAKNVSNLTPVLSGRWKLVRTGQPRKSRAAGAGTQSFDLDNYDEGTYHVSTRGTDTDGDLANVYLAYDMSLKDPVTPGTVTGSWWNDTGLADGYYVGTQANGITTGNPPVQWYNTSKLVLTQNFTGIVILWVTGVGVCGDDHTITVQDTSGQGINTSTSIGAFVSLDDTATMATMAAFITGAEGDLLDTNMVVTSCSAVNWTFAECGVSAITPSLL